MPELPSGTVTFLFTDIEGSTSLVRRLGDRYGLLLGDHRRLLRAAVEETGGIEVDCRADEFFGAFTDAQDAVKAALSAQRAFRLHEWPDELQLGVRMGIHTGEPALAEEGYLGLDVHRAARICAAANGGQVLVSESTRESLSDPNLAGLGFRDLGEHHLKDLSPQHIFQLVVADLPSEFPPLRGAGTSAVEPGPFEGREDELGQTAARRLRQALSGLRETWRSPPDLEELGWEVRTLLPEAPPDDQRPLAELAGALFASGRSVVEADRYVASLDRDSMERRLHEYREMGVVSRRARGEAEALASRIAHIDRLAARRNSVEETASELAAEIRSLGARLRDRQTSPAPAWAARWRPWSRAPRQRTSKAPSRRHEASSVSWTSSSAARSSAGCFDTASGTSSCYHDELGVEHRKEFQTRKEARSFHWSVRFAQEQKREYTESPV